MKLVKITGFYMPKATNPHNGNGFYLYFNPQTDLIDIMLTDECDAYQNTGRIYATEEEANMAAGMLNAVMMKTTEGNVK
mgnify:CR=1 FL=1